MAAHAVLFFLALCLSSVPAGMAGAVERLTWDDLVPAWDEPEDPVLAMAPEQREALIDILWVRNLLKRGRPPDKLMARQAEARATLVSAGLDVDDLISKIEDLQRQAENQNEALVEELDGREVMIPGYALPLEFSGTAMTEFLLVPYVGACIHTPPPPANQIVHVRSEQGVESEGLFTPVWVTGRMSTARSSQSLSYVDGVADISVGYGLQAQKVEPYEQ